MGIDFNGLVNIGQQIAARGKNPNLIDTASETSAFDVEVKSAAAKAGVDASEIYSDTNIASLMGATFSKATAEDTIGDADDLFALAGIAKPSVEEKVRIERSAQVIDSLNIEEIEAFSPDEATTFAYIQHHEDGTADRVGKEAAFLDEVANGDPELYEIAALIAFTA